MYKTVKPITLTLPVALVEDMNTLAKELNKKKTQIVTEALEMYMDYQDLQLAKERLQDDSGTLTHEELLRELGL